MENISSELSLEHCRQLVAIVMKSR
jgi:hypothetical protein